MDMDHAQDKGFVLKETYTMDELLELMDFLRSDRGCPWDRIQTHESIQGNMLEEAYEAVDAIQSGNPDQLREELGDVLMQVVFHSSMAEEAGRFTFEEVVSGICRKLISRHSHLFGEDQATTPAKVLETWEKNKKIEKGFKSTSEAMRQVPRAMPALTRAFKLQKQAAHVGFDWPDVRGANEKILEEYQELLQEIEKAEQARIHQEAGDLLFAVVNSLRLLGVDPEAALTACSERFVRRFSAMEAMAEERGTGLKDMSLQAMDDLWNEAKRNERGKEEGNGDET